MSRQLIGLPNSPIQKRENETIEIVKVLRLKGFTEVEYDKQSKTRNFNRIMVCPTTNLPRKQVFKINIREGKAIYANFTWSGNFYGESANYIKTQL